MATGERFPHVLQLQFLLVSLSAPLLVLAAVLRSELAEHRALNAAHVGRVRTGGEITAAVAHELNQALTAVHMNAAAAALSFLNAAEPQLDDVRAALVDIQADGKLASEIIIGLRGLLKEGTVRRLPLEINEVVRQVIPLMALDATRREIALVADLAPRLPSVSADRVQLQQVFLNLIPNGFDAMRGVLRDGGPRELVVRTRRQEDGSVEITVRDDGTGIDPTHLARIFDRFHTTKADGLGIGLSISRSIGEAHGGQPHCRQQPRPWRDISPDPAHRGCLGPRGGTHPPCRPRSVGPLKIREPGAVFRRNIFSNAVESY